MSRIQPRILLLATAVCVTSAALPARQKFTSTASLLTLDVSVLDRDGNPVSGLAPGDFVVTLNKEPHPVRTMVLLTADIRNTTEAVGVPAPGSTQSPTAASAGGASLEPDPKLLVILVDDISIYPTDSKGLFVAAERLVDTIPARDWVGLTSTSGRLMVNPSLDRAPLLESLKRAAGSMDDPRREREPFVGFMDALEADEMGASLQDLVRTACALPPAIGVSQNLGQLLAENRCASEVARSVRDTARFARVNTRNQLGAYTAAIKAMAAAPGVKQLVILTGGVALKPGDSAAFIPVATAAAAAGVQLTMLMEEPDDNEMSVRSSRAFATDQRRLLQQAETLAE